MLLCRFRWPVPLCFFHPVSRGFSSQPTDVDGGSFLGRPGQSSLFFHVVHQGVEQGAVNGITIDVEGERFFVEKAAKFPPEFRFQFVEPALVHDGANHAALVER